MRTSPAVAAPVVGTWVGINENGPGVPGPEVVGIY